MVTHSIINQIVNRHLFLRNHKQLKSFAQVEKRHIAIPDNVGSQMFERGDFIPFNMTQKIYVDSLYPGNPAEKAGLEVGDLLSHMMGNLSIEWGFK